jgi:hypothetical protein
VEEIAHAKAEVFVAISSPQDSSRIHDVLYPREENNGNSLFSE